MKEYINQIERWQREGKEIVLARVIQTWGSSPRPVGSCMLIPSDLQMAGSVSGGCVEGAVLKEAQEIFVTKKCKKLAFGVTDDEAWAVGLSCGGKIQVFLEPINFASATFSKLLTKLKANEGCVMVTKVADGESENYIIEQETQTTGLSAIVDDAAKKSFHQRVHQSITHEGTDFFIHVFAPQSKVIIIGAAHIAADLIQLASSFDFETIVIDPRGVFARNTIFPVIPSKTFEAYPSEILGNLKLDPYTYAVILSHDPKIDDDALHILLRSQVAYIGALGSRKNHDKRIARLIDKGFTKEEIARIDAPIGIDINALGAREIALSIMGAIIKAKNEFL